MAHETAVRPRVLIVDDDVDMTDLLSDALGKHHDCVTAGTAEEALDRLKEGHFELVLSDITMPGMSGLEMIPHVKSISPNQFDRHDQRDAHGRKARSAPFVWAPSIT